MKLSTLIKNFSYTIASNLIQMIISTLVILIIPKIVGVQEYGLFQLFIFYVGYVGLVHLGWLDGIYLRYGGEKYNKLDKELFNAQLKLLSIVLILFGLTVFLITSLVYKGNTQFIWYMISIAIVIQNIQTFFLYILQATNRITKYAFGTMIQSVTYSILIILFLILGFKNFKIFIISYIIAVLFSTIYVAFQCREILRASWKFNHMTFEETKENLKVGYKLLLANFSAMLIIGVIRFGIQRGWDVETFGKISLTLSISNLLMIFITAISLVLFPTLRRINVDNMAQVYSGIRDLLMFFLLVGVLLYFPINWIIPRWLPRYDDALMYLSILFPMVIYQGKFEILSNTFFKTLRMEKQLLIINLMSVGLSAMLTVISVLYYHSLTMTMFSIIVVMAFRSIISELYIQLRLNVNVIFEILVETTMVAGFILTTWYLSMKISIIIYTVMLIIYFLVKKKSIIIAINNIKNEI
ncbi:oligosaccharide flippase family protein [Dellaglioa algida]|uniref:Heteropolysaccharide repeat-containing protein n=1 Tax=Dellaglioa algida DSM 15638 TaxID=1423719 RepID=A0A0R1HGJ6_9LACO|nr:oligosaccharide flippase family protein [Dellaglioa algida]KRK45510.1 heteropolysaccharide repeat-containing protein [Dellaglioa algida DSM 15638]MDK1732059.1 oligosaccharide flippase family protein [Dellaglioa algida]MDK1733585.1 oligosaccharide flippase family protein [Dellaglioa algida]